jgi:hypothetical protein
VVGEIKLSGLKFNGIRLLLTLFLISCGAESAPAAQATSENTALRSYPSIFIKRPLLAFHPTAAESLEILPDSTRLQETPEKSEAKSSAVIPALETQLLEKSPTGALFRSLALPGWGQIYTRNYIRAAIYGSGEVILIGAICNFWSLSNKHRERFEFAQKYSRGDFLHTSGVTILPHGTQLQVPEVPQERKEFDLYQRFQDKRNFYLWITATWVFISMFDAYVDAHLYNFDKLSEEQVTIDFRIEDRNADKVCELKITKKF